MLSGFFVTKKGKNLLAKTHDGANIELTRAEIGSGDIPEGQLVTEVTSLYGKVKELPLGEVKVGSGKEVCIPVQLTNKGVLTSFLFKEIGVYAIDPDEGEILYLYGNTDVTGDVPDEVKSESESQVDYLFNLLLNIDNTTKVDVNVDNSLIYATLQNLSDMADTKVDKVSGKGLSTEDYTTAEKNKLAGIAAGANKYVHPSSHPMSMITGLDSALDGKVDKVNGKGLSTEDYTTAEKNKLAGIAAGANKYVHPSTHPVGMITGLGTAATENTGTSSGNVPVIESNGKLPAVIIPSDDGKQDKLTFDTSPKSGSTNPVTSAGIYTALAGKANSKHNQGHDTITFNPEANKAEGVFPLDRGYVDAAGACRTAFMPADAITVEYTQDNGVTWNPYSLTDIQKQGLFSMNRGCSVKLGGPNATAQTIGHGVRITVSPTDNRYALVDMLYCWFLETGVTCKCNIERSTIGAKTTFRTIRSDVPVSGNSGPNSITFAAGSFGGSADQTSNFYSYRFTFMTTAIHPTITSVPTVTDLRLYGDRVWRIPNQMMFNGHLYSWDTAQNATFPAQLSAPNMSAESGNVDNILKVGRTFYNVINLTSTKNIREIVIYTKIPLVNRMISLYITGYEYNSKGAVDLKISYNYNTANNQYRQYSATSSCGWKPDIYLFTYTGDDGVTYTAIGLQVLSSPNIYYPRLTVAMYDQWSDNNDYSKGWTTDYVLADAAEGETLISNNKLKVPYNNPTAADVGALSLAGGTLTGELVPNGGLAHAGTDGYIAYPDGGQYVSSISSVTGMLKIALPVSWTSTMLKFKVSIYNYKDNTSVDYILAGYNYRAEYGWSRTTAYCVSPWGQEVSNLPVSFGHDGTKCAITIGTPTTVWSYPQVVISDVTVAFEHTKYDMWKSGWSLSFVTEVLPTVNATISNTNITYNLDANNLRAGLVPPERLSPDPGVYTVNPQLGPSDVLHSSLDNPTLAEIGAVDSTFTNKIAFYPYENALCEISSDGGTTWTPDPNMTETKWKKLVSENNELNNTTFSANVQYRITFSSNRYCYLNAVYFYASMPASTKIGVKIERYNESDSEWSILTPQTNALTAQPDHFWLQHARTAFNPTLESKAYFSKVRITFIPAGNVEASSTIDLRGLRWYGTFPGTDHRTIYSWDGDKNVTFPAQLKASEVYDNNQRVYSPVNKPSAADITGLGTAATKNTGTAAGNVPVLGSDGKLPEAILPESLSGGATGQTWHAKDILGSGTTSTADATAESGYSVTIDTTAKNLNGSAKKYKAPFGTYVAIFRVQASTVSGSADKVKLEIWGTSAAIASRAVKLSDFSVASKWEYFKIPFETDSTSGRDIYPKVTCLNATGNVKVDNIVVVPNAFALM